MDNNIDKYKGEETVSEFPDRYYQLIDIFDSVRKKKLNILSVPKIKTLTDKEGFNEVWMEVGGIGKKYCQLECGYCFNSAGVDICESGLLGKDDYVRIVDNLSSVGVKTIGIPGAGEPLYASNLDITLDIVDRARSNNMHVVIFTNGFGVIRETIDRLDQKNVSIMLKFNSLSSKKQDKMVGIDGYSNVVNKFIRELVKRGFNNYDENNVTRLGFVNSVENMSLVELKMFFRLCRDYGIYPDLDTLVRAGRGRKFEEANKEDLERKFLSLQEIDRREYRLYWKISPAYVAGNCDRYRRHMYINRFGKIVPCLGMQLVGDLEIGDVMKGDGLKEAWNSEIMRKIRNREYIGECKECGKFYDGSCNSCLGRFVDWEESRKTGNIVTTGCMFKEDIEKGITNE